MKKYINKNKHWIILFSIIALYVIVFFSLSLLRYRSFISYEWQDESGVNNSLWHSIHGNFFYTYYPSRHWDKIIEVVFWPIYYLFPRMETIFFIQTFMLAISAWPLYLICLKLFKSRENSLLLTISYLLWAPLHNLNFASFRWGLVAPPFILFVYYFYLKKKYFHFLLSCITIALVREELFLFLGAFAIFAIFDNKNNFKDNICWIFTPLIIAGGMFVLTLFAIPFFNQGEPMIMEKFINQNLFNEINQYVQRFLNNSHIYFKLFFPLAFIGFFTPEIILIAPSLFLTAFMKRYAFLGLPNLHYMTMAVPVVFIAMLVSIKKIISKYPYIKLKIISFLILIASIITIIMPNILAQWRLYKEVSDRRYLNIKTIYHRDFFTITKEDQTAWKIIKQIPENASVACTGDLLPALSNRDIIVEYDGLMEPKTDYIMINQINLYFGAGSYKLDHSKIDINEKIEALIRGNYKLITKEGTYVLLKNETY